MKGFAAALACLVSVGCGGSSPQPVAQTRPAPTPSGPHEDCSTQSGADFSRAFTAPENLVVGPLVLIGGAYTPPAVVREFGGQKFPLLVMAGHRVTISVPRAIAGLAYGPLPQGETKLRDTHRKVTFVACDSAHAISSADGAAVTFWSGAVLTRRPACIPLEIAIDGGDPQRVGLALGKRC
jgi:hypothetical protein